MPDPNDRRLIKGATVVAEQGGAVRSVEAARSVRWAYNSIDNNIFYFADSDPYHTTPLDSAAVWKIAQLNKSSGTLKWADFAQYNQIWDNRESITYA